MAIKILVVEDDEVNLEMISRRLTKANCEVVVLVAKDGQEAIDMANCHMPDIILMDMGLPVIDGWHATGQLKSSDKTKSIPIIALTANAMPGDNCVAAVPLGRRG